MKNPLRALFSLKSEEREEVVDDEVHSTLIEKFVLKDGRVFLIYRPRIRHMIDGRKAAGNVANDEGDVSNSSIAINMDLVDKHIAMGWSRKEVKLVDCPDRPLASMG